MVVLGWSGIVLLVKRCLWVTAWKGARRLQALSIHASQHANPIACRADHIALSLHTVHTCMLYTQYRLPNIIVTTPGGQMQSTLRHALVPLADRDQVVDFNGGQAHDFGYSMFPCDAPER
jgi:hypothetical protein